jgi:predicted acyltransferase (DUF342 family)
MFIWIVFILFIALLLLPFIPGILELIKKEDSEPLFISMDYTRNPRYFGKSYKMLLNRATSGLTLSPGFHEVKLSKNEKIEITESIDIPDKMETNHLLYVTGNFFSGSHALFNKEVYVNGNAVIGSNNIIQAMVGLGSVAVSEGTQFRRWLDADGNITIGANCDLGISVSSGDKINLACNCVFRRLYGMPVVTGPKKIEEFRHPQKTSLPNEPSLSEVSFTRNKDKTVSAGSIINNNIVFLGNVSIGSGTIIKGTIKSYGDILLEQDVIVYGSIFADGDIFIGRNATINGHIFSQKSIFISEQSIISRPDKIKSIIGKKEIQIGQNVTVYGFISTEGFGKTVESISHKN